MPSNSDAEIQRAIGLIGDPGRVREELDDFTKDARLFSSVQGRLMKRYPKQWIAIYDGKVQTHGRTLTSLLRRLDELGLPRNRVMIRYIDKTPRTLILFPCRYRR